MEERRDRPAIWTPDQRLRIFLSSTLQELAAERAVARAAIERLHLTPVMFELGARPHPPRALYRAYLEQSHVFVAMYWERYGWVAPDMTISGLEDEYELAANLPKLLYVRTPAPNREPRLDELLGRIRDESAVSYRPFSTPEELAELLENDLATLLSERFVSAAMPTAAAGRRARVPAPLTGIVGRTGELAALRELLAPEGPRLVTLTGPGGIGKTRLAVEAARAAESAFPDGVFFVGLDAVRDPGLVAQAIAHALDVHDDAGRPDAELVVEWLEERDCLLVLDNFEHVQTEAGLVSSLSASCPRLHIVVTSRVPLHLRGETEILVEPLERFPAVELFAERARASRRDFKLAGGNLETVGEICRRLDGLPLAIELAAVQVRTQPLDAVLARLERRLDAVAAAPRDLPERQRSLRSTIAWSYDLLPPESRVQFEQLSVFVGGWTLDAAEVITNADGGSSAVERLADLIDASLVRVAVSDTSGPRFTMLETIREFGLEQLRARGGLDAVAERHARFFGSLALETGASVNTQQHAELLARLEREIDNLRAALDWLEATDRPAETLRIAASLWAFWERRGYVGEAVRRLRRALDRSDGVEPATIANALVRTGWLTRDLGDLAEAERLLDEGLRLWREIGDDAGVALALSNLGVTVIRTGDYDRANALLEESLALRRQGGDPVGVSATLINLGFVAVAQGEPERAVSRYTEALDLARAAGDDDHLVRALVNLGESYLLLDDAERAGVAFAEAESANARLGDRLMTGLLAGDAAIVAARLGDLARAHVKLREAVEVFEDLGARHYVVDCLECAAQLAEREGRAQTALRLIAFAESERRATGVSRSAGDAPEHEALLERLRSRLGDVSFDAEWEVGARLSFEESVALATVEAATSSHA